MLKQSLILSFLQRVAVIFFIVNLLACDDLSDVGNQSDAAPSANVIVQGVKASSSSTNTFVVRAGTDVLLSGKDSSGVDDPILSFEWAQTDSSGYRVDLIERSTNSRVFVAPIVGVSTDLSFVLTVIDADGKKSTDTVIVTVMPVSDVDGFLTHPSSSDAQLVLLVAPDSGQVTGFSEEFFDVNVDVVAHWRNRDGEYDSVTVSSELLGGSFTANYSAPADPSADTNPRLSFELPNLNIDLINKYFETEDRHRRLEIYQIDSAYLDLQLTLIPKSTSVSFKVYAFDGTNLLIATDLTTATVSGDTAKRSQVEPTLKIQTITDKPTQAILLDTVSSTLNVSVLAEELKVQMGVDNIQTGRNYYKLIDPTDQFLYLKDWLAYAGFTDEYGKALTDDNIAHAIYLNNYDLGFGRDMWTRYDETTGNVYSYVVNYPGLEAGVKGVGDFAVVVMEYSAYPTETDSKIVKFYAYVPDERDGGYIRASTMNFDGRGEKAVPGVCTSCHYQDSDTVDSDFTQVADADLGATFLPWDLDSFLYSDSSDVGQVDPSYNAGNVSATISFDATRAGQEAELKKMNQHALYTYIDDSERHEASIKLLQCMYGNALATGEETSLPEGDFDSTCVQEGWQEQESLYHDVYARYCRACHTQFPESAEDPAINFDTYADFISAPKIPKLKNYVYQEGRMPLARLTMDRFWIDFDGNVSAAETLRSHLESIGETVDTSPGEPLPNIIASGVTVTDDEVYPNQVSEVDTLVQFDGAASLFTETYFWEVTSEDCASLPVLSNSLSALALVNLDSDDFFPCLFEVALTTTNQTGSSTQNYLLRASRIPEAVNFTLDMGVEEDSTYAEYVSGDRDVTIEIADRIVSQGDGGIDVSLSGANLNVVNNNDGSIVYTLPNALQGISDSINYTVLDVDLSESNTGTISLIVPEISPSLSNQTPTASSVVLNWAVPTGFEAESYFLLQKEASDIDYPEDPIASYDGSVFSHQASSLAPNTNYNFKLVVGLDGDINDSNEISVSTVSGVPSGLVMSNRSSSSISISWSAGSGSVPTCYNVYRGGLRVGSCVSNAAPFQDTGLSANQSYNYTVSALFGADESSDSSPLTVLTNARAPTGLSISNGTTSVGLNWVDSLNAGSPQYRIYRNNVRVATVSSLSRNISVNSNALYDFRVCTYISSEGAEYCTGTSSIRTIATTGIIQNYNLGSGNTCTGCHALSNSGLEAKARASACFGVNTSTLRTCYTNVMGISISNTSAEIIHNWFLDIE